LAISAVVARLQPVAMPARLSGAQEKLRNNDSLAAKAAVLAPSSSVAGHATV
jgi:hypothetical protein